MHQNDQVGRLSDQFGTRALDAIKAQVGHRLDLKMADYRLAGHQLALISVGYDRRLGEPTAQELRDFVVQAWAGKLEPHLASARVFAEPQAVTLNVTMAKVCRPYADRQNMVPNGEGRYIEGHTKEVWTVEDNNGTPGLYRVAEEDLETLLGQKMAVASSRIGASKQLLAFLRADGRVLAVPGANVQFFDRETGQERVGRVMSEPDQTGHLAVRVTDASVDTRIHQNQISDQLTTAEVDVNTKKTLLDFYTQAFGDAEYARQLVEEKSVTGSKEELVAFLTDGGAMNVQAALAWTDTMRMAQGKIFTVGPNDMIMARYNGHGYEWEINITAADAVIKAQVAARASG